MATVIRQGIAPTDCPASISMILEYLDLEDYDRSSDEPVFFFEADSEARKLWVWRYEDDAGSPCYVVITQAKPAPRADAYEIGCGPVGSRDESAGAALAMFTKAGVW